MIEGEVSESSVVDHGRGVVKLLVVGGPDAHGVTGGFEALASDEGRVEDTLAGMVEAAQDDEGGAGSAEVRGGCHEVEALVV